MSRVRDLIWVGLISVSAVLPGEGSALPGGWSVSSEGLVLVATSERLEWRGGWPRWVRADLAPGLRWRCVPRGLSGPVVVEGPRGFRALLWPESVGRVADGILVLERGRLVVEGEGPVPFDVAALGRRWSVRGAAALDVEEDARLFVLRGEVFGNGRSERAGTAWVWRSAFSGSAVPWPASGLSWLCPDHEPAGPALWPRGPDPLGDLEAWAADPRRPSAQRRTAALYSSSLVADVASRRPEESPAARLKRLEIGYREAGRKLRRVLLTDLLSGPRRDRHLSLAFLIETGTPTEQAAAIGACTVLEGQQLGALLRAAASDSPHPAVREAAVAVLRRAEAEAREWGAPGWSRVPELLRRWISDALSGADPERATALLENWSVAGWSPLALERVLHDGGPAADLWTAAQQLPTQVFRGGSLLQDPLVREAAATWARLRRSLENAVIDALGGSEGQLRSEASDRSLLVAAPLVIAAMAERLAVAEEAEAERLQEALRAALGRSPDPVALTRDGPRRAWIQLSHRVGPWFRGPGVGLLEP